MVSINLAIGPSCFVRCTGCYNQFANTHRRGGLVTATQVLGFASDARHIGVDQATISGGDPLTHPEILTVLQGLHRLGFRTKLDTVGTAFLGPAQKIFFGSGEAPGTRVEEVAPYVHTLGLPIDGATDDSQRLFRTGRVGIVAEVLTTIGAARAVGMRVSVNTVLHRANVREVTRIMELVAASGADGWQVFEFQPTGPIASRNVATFELEDGEFDDAERAVRHVAPHHLDITFKSRSERMGMYFLVDDAGFAWKPKPSGADRVVIGHIESDRGAVLRSLRGHVRAQRPGLGSVADLAADHSTPIRLSRSSMLRR
jgi:MoaA/NifB/PqqE/SkfB family radical SAM enzyme